MSVNLESLKDLKELSCIRNRALDLMSSLEYIGDVLVVDLNGTTRDEVTCNHHRKLGIEYAAACESASDSLIYLDRIYTCLGSKGKCFTYDSNVVVDYDLVNKLCC